MSAGALGISERRALVARVADSPSFLRSPRLREFLLYAAECTLNNRLDDARELRVAENVFHRNSDYNPGQDNIVRVEARSLRKRLDAYFADAGKDEPIVITMPKGGYILAFEAREFPATPVPDSPVALPPSAEGTANLRGDWKSRLEWVAVGIFLALLVWAIYSAVGLGGIPDRRASSLPFSALIDSKHDTYIVTSDTTLVLVQELLQRQISLGDYLARRFEFSTNSSANLDLAEILKSRNYTNAAEMGVAAQIIQRQGLPGQRIFLRSCRDIQFSYVKNQNVILLGSPIGNPWVKLFSDKLNFQFEMDKEQRGMFRSRAPLPGEQPLYSMTTRSGEGGDAYAVLAFLPNLNRNGHVLLIAGTTSEGTQAGGEFIMDEQRTAKALSDAGIGPTNRRGYFEILLRTKTVAGSATESSIVSYRPLYTNSADLAEFGSATPQSRDGDALD